MVWKMLAKIAEEVSATTRRVCSPDRVGRGCLTIQDARSALLDSTRASRNPWAHDQQSARNRLTAFRSNIETPPRVPDGAEGFLLNEAVPG